MQGCDKNSTNSQKTTLALIEADSFPWKQSNFRKMLSYAILLLLFFSSTTASIQYVKPTDSSPDQCPDLSCLTIDQYILQGEDYFTNRSTFIFLQGHHSLNTSLNLNATSNITLRGNESGSKPIVKCNEDITVTNVTNLSIEDMIFILQLKPSVTAALLLIRSQNLEIINSVFQRESTVNQGAKFLHVISS